MVVWIGLLAAALSTNPLAPAEQAFAEKRYEAVRPALEKARARALTPQQEVRADALEAMTDAAFDESEPAIEAFRRALELDPTFQVDPKASPKIRGLFDEARRRDRLLHPPPQPVAPPTISLAKPTAPPAPEAPVWKRWWFWTAAGVVTAGAAAGIWYAAQPRFPSGSLGQDALK